MIDIRWVPVGSQVLHFFDGPKFWSFGPGGGHECASGEHHLHLLLEHGSKVREWYMLSFDETSGELRVIHISSYGNLSLLCLQLEYLFWCDNMWQPYFSQSSRWLVLVQLSELFTCLEITSIVEDTNTAVDRNPKCWSVGPLHFVDA